MGDQMAAMGRAMERAMALDDAVWARHANPWSGWTRAAILPLGALAIWARVWIGCWVLLPLALLLAWVWINPRAFPPPAHHRAWMTRAVFGERIWLARDARPIPPHHGRAAALLSILAGLGMLPLVWGLWRLDLGWTVAGLAISVGGKLWFLDRMVWLYEDRQIEDSAASGPAA